MLYKAGTAGAGRGGRRGLTLVELLVSIGLTIFLLTLFAILFQSGNNAVANARGVAEIDRQVRGAITRLRRDLQHVYLGDGVSLAHIYERYGPKAGYFTIEENMPGSPPYMLESTFDPSSIADAELRAIVQILQQALALVVAPNASTGAMYRQGVDARGVPVEMDVDDVLAFTVRLPGTSRENIFVGRVPKGSVLDNGFNPESRFDQPNNGLFTSPLAEVVYFLRPDRPYRLSEINNPAVGASEGRLIQTPTFTLYRRELLLLTEGQRQSLETPKDPAGLPVLTGGVYPLDDMLSPLVQALNPGLVPGSPQFNPSFFQHYDVSAYFGYDQKRFPNPSSIIDLYNLQNYTLRWNSPETIRQRRNRYGMVWLGNTGVDGNPANATPLGAPLDPDGAVPDYDHVRDPTADPSVARQGFRTYAPVLDPLNPTQPKSFRGRPTLFESTLIGSEGLAHPVYNPTAGAGTCASLDAAAIAAAEAAYGASPSTRRRSGGDVLLQNVLSFDVKVLNDDLVPGPMTNAQAFAMASAVDVDPRTLEPIRPLDEQDWPAFRTMALAPRDPLMQLLGGNNQRFGLLTGNASRRPGYSLSPPVPAPASMIQPDFIDLGTMLAPEVPARGRPPSDPFNPSGDLQLNIAVARYYTPLGFVDPTSLPNNPPFPYPIRVNWGQQTPARWMTTGRRESSSAIYDPNYASANSNFKPLRSTYDTWAPEYYPEYFSVLGDIRQAAGPGTVVPPAYTPPYDRPLRGIQITIRVLEPKSGVEREFRLVHRFD